MVIKDSNVEVKAISNEEWLAASFYQMPAAWRKSAGGVNTSGRRRYNAAYFKFTDTTFGGSDVVNPRHQYTEFADPPIKGISAISQGMGEWYSSTIDDHKHKVHIGPGIPSFNSTIGFMKNYYEAETGFLANTGRGSSLSFQVGKYIAKGAVVAGAVAVAGTGGLVALSLVAGVTYGFSLTKKMYNYLAEEPSSKYYYLKPSAELYWNAVSNIMNTLCVYTGFVERPHIPLTSRIDTSNLFYSPEDAKKFREYMPEIFREDGSIDVFRLSRKAQILQDVSRDNLEKILAANGTDFDTRGSTPVLIKRIRKYLDMKLTISGTNAGSGKFTDGASIDLASMKNNSVDETFDFTSNLLENQVTRDTSNLLGINNYFQEYLDSELGKVDPSVTETLPSADTVVIGGGDVNGLETETVPSEAPGWLSERLNDISSGANSALNGFENARALFKQAKASVGSIMDFGKASARGGADFVSYHVDYAGAIQESFSNSSGVSEIASTMNGTVSSMRSKRFSVSDGNLTNDSTGFLAGIQGVASAVTGGLAGLSVGLGLDGLIAMSGKGFADIPKTWQDSSANLPRMSYSIELRAVYGHRYDIMTSILYPLATLLAFVLPRSTGKQSYTMPFLVRAFDKGRAVCRLGIMSELSISRGEGNVAWNDDLLPLAVNVSFTIEDLSSVMHMPIAPVLSLGDLLTIGAGAVAGGTVGGVAGAVTSVVNGSSVSEGISAGVSGGKETGKHIGNLLTTGNWDDDNTFTDYMSALGSLDITDMINATNRAKLRMAQRVTNFNTQFSASYIANHFHGTIPGRVLAALANQGAVGG